MTVTTREIALNLLVPASENVRKTKTGDTIGLQASIAQYGLVSSLVAYPVKGPKGKATGKFAVAAGSRRHDALNALAEAGTIAANYPVICRVCTREEARALSLAENHEREDMNIVDQYEAFAELVESGLSTAEVAIRFGLPEGRVLRRMKLGRMSPKLRAVMRAGEMTLDQGATLILTDDHAMQERAWFDVQPYERHANHIRSRLTVNQVPATDARALLVGLDAYEAAGGDLVRDLFNEKYVMLKNVALLDQLAADVLQAKADALSFEGWAWVLPVVSYSFDHAEYGYIQPITRERTAEEEAQLEALYDEQAQIEQGSDGELTEEEEARLEANGKAIQEIEDATEDYSAEQMAGAGVIVMLGRGDDPVRIEGGLVRRMLAAARASAPDAQGDEAEGEEGLHEEGQALGDDGPETPAAGDEAPAEEAFKPLSGALMQELTAERTMALRVELARNPRVALIAAAHAYAIQHVYGFYSYNAPTSLELQYQIDRMSGAPKVKDSPAAAALDEELKGWRERLPAEVGDLWSFLLAAPQETVLALMAFGVSQSINAVDVGFGNAVKRAAHGDLLATALDLDMTNWWTVSPDNYLSRVPKVRVLEAVTDAVSPQAADNIAGMKKAGMVSAAVDRLAGTGWLPAVLRTVKAEAPIEVPAETEDEGAAIEMQIAAE